MEERTSEEIFLIVDSTADYGVTQSILQRITDHPMTRCMDGKSAMELLTQSWLYAVALPKRSSS
jgi:hypothetical protein